MKDYLQKHPWKIIEDRLDPANNLVSESIASLGNGRLGGRGNFEEKFNGPTLPGSYIAGIYYPDKTRVGWWKNGYPEYFAKVLNSVRWIGVDVWIDDEDFEITPGHVEDFYAELDMKEGMLRRRMTCNLSGNRKIRIEAERFYSMADKNRCFLHYSVTPLNFNGRIGLKPYLDFNVRNQDANYDETFWIQASHTASKDQFFVTATTKKTGFSATAAARHRLFLDGSELQPPSVFEEKSGWVQEAYEVPVKQGQTLRLEKYTAICSTFYMDRSVIEKEAVREAAEAAERGYDTGRNAQISAWAKKWEESDVVIDGDVGAQQGIRFNLFQLHQTYAGDDDRLNIGPKGFTGEKYGGSTYWDTEAYCLPFYLSNAPSSVALNLLRYRYKHLDRAIENAKKLGFSDGAALYPMVTMNGEECHNEWEITFEEIHRNGAIAYAIYDYIRYTGDDSYLTEGGLEVLIGIARFWSQRVHWSEHKKKYVMLGVTGPNEYENNVNNNWYTNYIAVWCMNYAAQCLQAVRVSSPDAYEAIRRKTNFDADAELTAWKQRADHMFFPFDEKRGIFLQQEGFLDKELIPVDQLDPRHRPINEHWSWDRILRSCYIKQADVLQGLYFFEESFSKEELRRNFEFYEPLTVHESSLSPCVHSILACSLGMEEKAYEMYLRTARLDLDDYNNDTRDGLHITSMAGTWMSVAKGFGGMRIVENTLSFSPILPKQWEAYRFKIRFRTHIVQLEVSRTAVIVHNRATDALDLIIFGNMHTIQPDQALSVPTKS